MMIVRIGIGSNGTPMFASAELRATTMPLDESAGVGGRDDQRHHHGQADQVEHAGEERPADHQGALPWARQRAAPA